MPIFKYTVANSQGKKLSGTVEAPSEKIARAELNNLGFSILTLAETQEKPKIDPKLKTFIFEAVDKNSKLISGTIPAHSEDEAFQKLHIEYALTVTAIWPDGATEEEIKKAKNHWGKKLHEELQELESQQVISQQENKRQQREELFLRKKIEKILTEVTALLQEFNNELDSDQKAIIQKKVNKLLRIKHSKNLNYIQKTAEELLLSIKEQDKYLKEKGFQDKRLQLQIKVKRMLDELQSSAKAKSISEDIVRKIENWELTHKADNKNSKTSTKFFSAILARLKRIFETPPQIIVIKNQISAYNKQLFQFTKLYFKEPTKQYKAKVKSSIKTIWKARKKAKHSLKHAKKLLRKRQKEEKQIFGTPQKGNLLAEINSLSGWLLTFYLIYYFIGLFFTAKNFGFSTPFPALQIYESQLFKYILVILFLLHAATALRINFFKKSRVAAISLPTLFVFLSILAVLNF